MKAKPFEIAVKRCARCGKNHKKVLFKPFKNENPTYTHWALCPTNEEPILMIVREDT